MRVHLLRHGCAGRKEEWPHADALRPLDPGGERQADELAAFLADHEIRRLAASPTTRCVETLRPLARRTGLPIDTLPELGKDSSAALVHALVVDPRSDGALYCTHGELLTKVLARLRAAGVVIEAQRDEDDWLLLKGSAWELAVVHGEIELLHHRVPLPLHTCGKLH